MARLKDVGRAEMRQARINAIRAALRSHKGNVDATAKALGVQRPNLYAAAKDLDYDLAEEARVIREYHRLDRD